MKKKAIYVFVLSIVILMIAAVQGDNTLSIMPAGDRDKPFTIDESAGDRDKPFTIDESAGDRDKPFTIDESAGDTDKPFTIDESAGDTDKPSTADEHIVMLSGNVGEPGRGTDGESDNGTVVNDTEIKEAYITLIMLSGSRDHIDIVDTNSARQRIIKGDYLCSQAKYDEAIKAYDEAIWIDPYNVDAWNGKGNALYHQGKYKASIKAYDMVIKHTIKSDPKLALAWYNKGIALKALGLTGEADAAFAKAKELGIQGLSRSI